MNENAIQQVPQRCPDLYRRLALPQHGRQEFQVGVPLAEGGGMNRKLDDLAFGNPTPFCQRDALGHKRLGSINLGPFVCT